MIRSITIKPVLNGFIATVGCQEVVFTSLAALSAGLTEYYTDPNATEKRYWESAVNKALSNLVPPPTPAPCDTGAFNAVGLSYANQELPQRQTGNR